MAQRRSGTAARGARLRPSPGSLPGSRPNETGANARPSGAPSSRLDAVEPEALVVSHWFDPGLDGEPYAATVRLRGRRVGSHSPPRAGETFVHEETIDQVVPGSGPVSLTSWIYGLAPGEWTVTGELFRPVSSVSRDRHTARRPHISAEPLPPASWSWRRWALSTSAGASVKTRWAMLAPLVGRPAVMPGIWPAMGTLGIIVALATQAALLARAGLSVGRPFVASLIVLVASLVAAKLWYAALHPGPWRDWIGGWSVDGFVFVAPPVAVLALLALHLPIGTFLDASTPGIFFGVAIGRIGCFFTGCCGGRCTASRWGLWSSDRRIGARRVPTQLLESAAGLLLGLVSLALVLAHVPGIDGAVFVAAFGAYILVRQGLLRLRAERREFSWRRSGLLASKAP